MEVWVIAIQHGALSYTEIELIQTVSDGLTQVLINPNAYPKKPMSNKA